MENEKRKERSTFNVKVEKKNIIGNAPDQISLTMFISPKWKRLLEKSLFFPFSVLSASQYPPVVFDSRPQFLINIIISVPLLPEDVVYQGRVSESGGRVVVYPEIKARHGPICGFRIVNTDWGTIPFEVRLQHSVISRLGVTRFKV